MADRAEPENRREPGARRAPWTESGRAVFLSYASQDAEAASRISEALRAAGIEVWFDQTELRGGDAWDRMIRRQIKGCYLFVPMISANTQAREEGYFRREWKIAVDRTNDMAEDRAFLLPIVIDGTSDSDARVPEKFREVQWTRLSTGVNTDSFVQHVRLLLSAGAPPLTARSNRSPGLTMSSPGVASTRLTSSTSRSFVPWITGSVLLLATGYVLIDKLLTSKHDVQVAQAPAKVPAPTETVSEKSVAVLPFIDMSENKDQEYFSDGLSEELIDMLANVQELKVAARTSSFYFKGKQTTIAEIAKALGVSYILEGSVRKSGNHLRITVQLIKAGNGFHLWSHTYDPALTETLKVQTDVATSVAQQLMLALASDVRDRMTAGGTLNPAAYDAYLRGSELYRKADPDESQYGAALAELDRAVALDPKFALAHAKRATLISAAIIFNIAIAVSNPREHARQEANLAVALAPEMAETHLAMAGVLAYGNLDFAGAAPELERAMALSPGNADVLASFASFESALGHYDIAIKAARSATVLDPLNFNTHTSLGQILIAAGRYREALVSLGAAAALEPKSTFVQANIGEALLASGANEQAVEACKQPALPKEDGQLCLAIAYHRLGRTAEAEENFRQLRSLLGDTGSVMIAGVYTQWGDRAAALASLTKAEKLKDPELQVLRSYWALDPIRSEPQFKAIEARMKFPP
jgi:TolB-like protein/Flp pilus assembly protein TadD